MTTPESLKEDNDSLYEWINLPAEWFTFWNDLPDWDPEKEEESNEQKINAMKEFINNSPATEDEKEVLISLIEWVEENKETFENVYEIVKRYKVQKLLEMPGEVQKLTKEVVEETSKYLLSEPKRIRNFVEKLHLPMDKKDILVSIMLSTILPALWLPLPVDPITVNSLYNSTTLLEEIGNRIKSDTRYVRDIAAKITGQIIDRIF